MNSTAKLEISVLAGAFTLGILGDALLRSLPWGINFAVWGSLLAAAIIYLARARRQVFADGGRGLLLPVVLCPLAFVWRDSWALNALNLFSMMVALSLAMLARPQRPAAKLQSGAICMGKRARRIQRRLRDASSRLRQPRVEQDRRLE